MCLCRTHACARTLLAETDPVRGDRREPSAVRHLDLGFNLIIKTKTDLRN